MTAEPATHSFAHTVWKKDGMKKDVRPIWCWRLQQHGITVAFGERQSEQGAIEAARLAEQRYGSTLTLKP